MYDGKQQDSRRLSETNSLVILKFISIGEHTSWQRFWMNSTVVNSSDILSQVKWRNDPLRTCQMWPGHLDIRFHGWKPTFLMEVIKSGLRASYFRADWISSVYPRLPTQHQQRPTNRYLLLLAVLVRSAKLYAVIFSLSITLLFSRDFHWWSKLTMHLRCTFLYICSLVLFSGHTNALFTYYYPHIIVLLGPGLNLIRLWQPSSDNLAQKMHDD